MENSLNTKKFPSDEIIQEIATRMSVFPSFVEKDWYMMQVLRVISRFNFEGVLPVFSGGTSLSKGYDLIKRFSEDIDFKLKADKNDISRAKRKKFRQELFEQINSIQDLSIDESSIIKRNESSFFSCNILYPQRYDDSKSLRPNLKLEMGFNEVYLDVEARRIASFISNYTNQNDDIIIACISPVETAADKLNALLWRIGKRYILNKKETEPSIIRHLYDLCSLKTIISGNSQFIETFIKIFPIDKMRFQHSMEFNELTEFVFNQLKTDKTYLLEYEQFVDAMFYGSDEEHIDFKQAKDTFQEIVEQIKSHKLMEAAGI